MPLLLQKLIKREDLRRNRNAFYVFGDNVRRVGMGGQAGEMRLEDNAVGVATKYAPSMDPDAFFGDEPQQVLNQNRIIDNDMKPLYRKLRAGGIVVWPADGIGTGLSQLPSRAPKTFSYLERKLAALTLISNLFDAERFDDVYALVKEHEDIAA